MEANARWDKCEKKWARKRAISAFKRYGVNILSDTKRLTGCVYFVQGESGGPIKIGYSADIVTRITKLQKSYPDKLKVLSVIPGDFKTEAAIHKQLAEYRLQGEWFNPAPAVLEKAREFKQNVNRGDTMRDGYKLVLADKIFRDTTVKVYTKINR